MEDSRPQFNLGLLTPIRIGSPEAEAEWRRLFSHFNPRLTGYFRQRLDDSDELDDLMADLWRRVLLHVHQVKSPNALWSWMLRIGINLLRDRGRQGLRMAYKHESLDDLLNDDAGGLVLPHLLDDPEDGIDPEVIRNCVARLDLEDKQLLELIAIDELSHVDAAKQLGLSGAEASRKRWQRLKRRVRNCLGDPTAHLQGGHDDSL